MAHVFTYVVIERAKSKDDEDKLVVEPTTVLAESDAAARILAARAIPETADVSKCEVIVRPF